jgi:3-hydroxyacyl-CoA dehydrogenase/enoyl-CoA hydratase/3-hydroxybutyryl-CoA epimerase
MKHWHITKDKHNIIWLGADREGATSNIFTEEVFYELQNILVDLPPDAKGLVLYSAKETGFFAGADIKKLAAFKDVRDIDHYVRLGQSVLTCLSQITIPTVAIINGYCIGGGTELALACKYRIISDADNSVISFPEVLLGFFPAWGGITRLPAIVGAFSAMSILLTGRNVRGPEALKMGLVHARVPTRQCTLAATNFILKNPKIRVSLFKRKTNSKWLRPLLAKIFYSQLRARVNREHYPAPYKIVEHWQQYGVKAESFNQELPDALALIAVNDTAKNLIRVAVLQDQLKTQATAQDFPVKHVHVIGAGVMGGTIAAWCALRGMRVTLQDQNLEAIAPAIKRAHALFVKQAHTPRKIAAAFDRLIPDAVGAGIRHADVIIEAIYENLDAKQTLFKRIEREARPDALIATNTSSIPIEEIAAALNAPERLLGIHFFNPVDKMQLVEVVMGAQTHLSLVPKALSFVRQLERLPMPVKSTPGFLVNRIILPYLLESLTLVREGVSIESIDKAALDFGFMMGPIELTDTIGFDVCLSVLKFLQPSLGLKIPPELIAKVEAGDLGKKSGRGFYTYSNGKPQKNPVAPGDLTPIANRLVQATIRASQECLAAGVVTHPDWIDAALIFGMGWAPFRGGPLHYQAELNLPT